jgi:hypothetical protein
MMKTLKENLNFSVKSSTIQKLAFAWIGLALFTSGCSKSSPGPGTRGSSGDNLREPLTVSSVEPAKGTRKGGTQITLEGTGFSDGLKVSIGSYECTDVNVISSKELTCKTGRADYVGDFSIYLTSRGEYASLSDSFKYVNELSFSSVIPTSASIDGGDSLYIYGAGFEKDSKITVLGTPCKYVSGYESFMHCKLGKSTRGGLGDIEIQNSDGASVTGSKAFTYLFPRINVTGITPASGSTRGGTLLTVRGSGFRDGATVSIGNVSCGSVTVRSDGTSLTCVTGAVSAAQNSYVRVRNADGQDPYYPLIIPHFSYEVPRVILSRVEPNVGLISGGTEITLRGTNFMPGLVVTIGGGRVAALNCSDVRLISSTEMRCRTPQVHENHQGLSIEVTGPGGIYTQLENAFTYQYTPPRITGISHGEGLEGDMLIIEGTSFTYLNGNNSVTVRLGTVPCHVEEVHPTSILCRIGQVNREGAVDVIVTNSDGQRTTLPGRFRFAPLPQATIAAIHPPTGTKNGDTLVLIRGTNFRPGLQVKIRGSACAHITQRNNTITCMTSPGRAGVGAPSEIEVINAGAQPVRLAGAYTYQDIPQDALTFEQLNENNRFGGANPGNQDEVRQIQNTLRLRRESGNPVVGRYYLDAITGGLKLVQPIRSFSVQGVNAIEQVKRDFLASREATAIPFENLRNYVQQVFPNGRVRAANDPLYVNWTQLVDFSYQDENGFPRQVGSTEGGAIATASHSFDTLIAHTSSNADSGWALDLKYQVKRVLVELARNPDPEKIKTAVIVFTSVGQHCGPGNGEGAVVVARNFFGGRTLHVNLREPVSVEDFILNRLDQRREEIFQIATSFEGDSQTAHTRNHFRQLVYQDIQIAAGFNDPYANYANFRDITKEQFLNRFFRGKVGSRQNGVSEEDRRSHIGYTVNEVAKTVIEFFHLNSPAPHYAPEMKTYFTSSITAQQAQDWLTHLDNAGLTRQAAVAYTDCDTSTPATRQACIQELREFYQGQDQALKEAMINSLYFEQRGAHFFLTEEGIREFLQRIQVLQPE